MDPPSAIQENANQNPPRMVYMYFKKKLKLGRVIGGWMLDLSFRTWVSYHTPIPTTLYLQEEGGGWGTESGQFNMIGGHVWFFKITNEMKRKWSIFSTIIGHHAETNKQRKTHTKNTEDINQATFIHCVASFDPHTTVWDGGKNKMVTWPRSNYVLETC